MSEAYDGREVVGMDLHRRRSQTAKMTANGCPQAADHDRDRHEEPRLRLGGFGNQ